MSESEDEVPRDEVDEESDEDNESEDDFEEEDSSEEDKFVNDIETWEGESESFQTNVDFSDGKFDKSQIDEYVKKHHPEVSAYTYDEMYKTMTSNETLCFLTRFEVTAMLGFRTMQLNKGAEPLIDTDLTDSYQIAKKELDYGKLPFIIRRPLPDGTFVHVRACDLQMLI